MVGGQPNSRLASSWERTSRPHAESPQLVGLVKPVTTGPKRVLNRTLPPIRISHLFEGVPGSTASRFGDTGRTKNGMSQPFSPVKQGLTERLGPVATTAVYDASVLHPVGLRGC